MLAVEDVQALFAEEADLRLRHLDELLLRLESTGDDAELVGSIYRELHTLKGSAGVAGLAELSREAHDLEELVDRLRAGRDTAAPAVIDRLLGGVDRLRVLVRGEPEPEAETEPETVPAPPVVERSTAVLVPTERLDELVRLVGESATANLRLGRMLKERVGVDPAGCPEFNELSRTVNDLQDRTMRTRMVPVSTITDQLQRAVRDLARAQQKEIDWEVRGGDTELDRSVLDQLTGSLVQLVRNAVDHGIESPAERVAAGKPARARIALHAMQLGSEVTIAVTDDGRGIDAAAVRAQASRQGVDTEALGEEDILELTFRPGLSTSSFVTDVSGRGVGLDVVRTNVEGARGRVEVRSRPGQGCEFRIVVPITLAVLRCLLVEAGGMRFALPFHRVLRSQPDRTDDRVIAAGQAHITVDERLVPVSGLAETLTLDAAPTGPRILVVLGDTGHRHAFRVDRLVGQRDVVLKGLSRLLPHLPAVAGASVEPDGTILIVLDPPGLLQRARSDSRRPREVPVPSGAEHAPRHRVLVVDDALTVRELQRGILERAGFDVRVAVDGSQALAMLAEEVSDLVLTDVEMPNLDGFALTRAIRAHPALANTPVLILSSRASEADRQRGLDAGADGYIVKSGFDEGRLLSAVTRLIGGRR